MLRLACAVLLAAAAESRDLARGDELFAQYKWADARAAFTKARTTKGLSREQLLHLLELSGIAAAQQRQPDAAQAAFVELLSLDADHKLGADYAPKVMTPFFEAKRLVDERGGPLWFGVESAVHPGGQTITARVIDRAKLARAVRFFVRGEPTVVPLVDGKASFDLPAGYQRFSAEVLGENEAQLLVLPERVELAAPAPAVAPAALAPEPSPIVTAQPSRGLSTLRTVAVAALVVGVAGAGGGGYFAYRSQADYGKVTGATRDAMGRISGISETDAYTYVAHGQLSAGIADGLFIGAGVLGLLAVLLWSLGG